MTTGQSLCAYCARNTYESGTVDGILTGRCTAFPDGIPLEIFADGYDHRQPFTDDPDELTFKLADGVTLDHAIGAIE